MRPPSWIAKIFGYLAVILDRFSRKAEEIDGKSFAERDDGRRGINGFIAEIDNGAPALGSWMSVTP